MSAPPVHDLVAWLDERIREVVEEKMAALRPVQPEWFTVREAADHLRVSPRTVERLVASGDVRSSVVGGRRIIRREWLDEYAAAREEVAPTTPPRRRATTVRPANHSLGGQPNAR